VGVLLEHPTIRKQPPQNEIKRHLQPPTFTPIRKDRAARKLPADLLPPAVAASRKNRLAAAVVLPKNQIREDATIVPKIA